MIPIMEAIRSRGNKGKKKHEAWVKLREKISFHLEEKKKSQ